ncbi:MAG: hypothetical protein ABJL99_14670 [Aliishimia sp.]
MPFPKLRMPTPAPVKYLLDPFAFFAALICAPLLVALLGFWLLLIPVFAIFFGGIPYLMIGTPVLLYYIPRHGAHAQKIGFLALKITTLGCAIFALITQLPPKGNIASMVFLTLFALLFATLWGHAFGWLYGKFQRDFYKNARL